MLTYILRLEIGFVCFVIFRKSSSRITILKELTHVKEAQKYIHKMHILYTVYKAVKEFTTTINVPTYIDITLGT